MESFKLVKAKNLENLPQKTGVYLFYGKSKTPIYIGKAVNIKNRVKNHFLQPNYKDELFISQINKVGYSETNSEIEALILEAQLIKKYQPKYNIMWRDDKNYFYVALRYAQGKPNKEKIPYVYTTHQPKLKAKPHKLKANFIGPFVDGTALKKTLRFLRKAFPYYTSKTHSKNKCTYCHLGLCPGPVPNLAEYKKNIKKLILVLSGKRSRVLNSLKKEMKQLSKENKFEEAAKIRDRIYNLQQVMAHTHVIENPKLQLAGRIECYDVSNIQGKFAAGSMVAFINGQPAKNQYKKFKIKLSNEPNDIAMLKEVLQRRFAHKDWPMPDAILIDGGKAQLNVALKIVDSLKIKNWKLKIKVLSIAKGRQELFIEGNKNPIPLKALPQEVYNLIKQLDDEAHRFAIKYHRLLYRKQNYGIM